MSLEEALRSSVDGEVRFDAGSRAAYSTDASNYRQVPIGVVVPRSADAAAEALDICREHDVPVVSRGGGTSLAGQCTNAAVVFDWSKYCNRLLSMNPEDRTCIVEPGIVLDVLNGHLRKHGLRFGPEPATHPNCTLGGMIGNNSCGATAQRTGKVVDNVARLQVRLYDGATFWCGETSDDEYGQIERHGDRRAAVYRSLRRLRDEYGDEIRRRYPRIPRRVSGYNLDSLLPEYDFDVAGLLVGSESTLVTVLQAELELVEDLPERALVIVGFPDIAAAGDGVPDVLPFEPMALEGIDRRLIRDELARDMNREAVNALPDGTAFLLVQFAATEAAEARDLARKFESAARRTRLGTDVAIYEKPEQQKAFWKLREAGLAATARVPADRDTWPGWEDSAVDPNDLGRYLRDLEGLFRDFGFSDEREPSLYGHFGQGCVHTSIPFDLITPKGVRQYRDFIEAAADLVTGYGGSLSGEHGDGQTRAEFLPKMFGPTIMQAFADLKHVFDPLDRMNPGKIVHPYAADTNLRLGADWEPRRHVVTSFRFPDDDGSFTRAAMRCAGVGKCRQQSHSEGSVMCPSYQVTREEEHSTRGRARVLFEMLEGHDDATITTGWRSSEVRDALDLCLSCKGCKADCPVKVDMATYKAEFLHHHYARRIRPRSHYTLGWLPVMAAGVVNGHLARPVNALFSSRKTSRALTSLAGVEDRRLPRFALASLQQTVARGEGLRAGSRGTVVLWPDTFTNYFDPDIGRAAIDVMQQAGWTVQVPGGGLCCGLTWISTGQLSIARRLLRRTLHALSAHIRTGGLVVGLEPSCTAVFRSDLLELFPDDPDAQRLSRQTVTLAELLIEHTEGWNAPSLHGARAVAQVHCHQHAVLGWDADNEVLRRSGVAVDRLDSGCCGLAGNFGFEPGHKEISVAIAEQAMLPALRKVGDNSAILADGFSCRTQIGELLERGDRAQHLAQLLAAPRAEEPAPDVIRPTTGETMPRPFSTSDDSPLDRQSAVEVPPVAEPASGADTWDQMEEGAESDGVVDLGDYGNPRDSMHDLDEGGKDDAEESDL